MNHLLTLSFILLGIAVVHVHCGPAPPVTQLRFYPYVFKDNGYTKFYFYQMGYGHIYVNFNGAQVSELKYIMEHNDVLHIKARPRRLTTLKSNKAQV